MGVSNITIVGNLGKAPEIKTAGDTKIAKFSVAVSHRVKKDGQWQDAPTWFNVVAFGRQADFAERFLNRGSSVAVCGTMQADEYTDKEGQRKTWWEVRASSVDFAGKKSDSASQSGGSDYVPPGGSDDIPF